MVASETDQTNEGAEKALHLATVRGRRAIAAFIRDLEVLSPVEFELVAHDLVQIVEGADLVHRGTTLKNHPVGYSVDTFDPVGKVVGEYGTEEGYFSEKKKLKKLREDIEHAFLVEPEHRTLYLMSNQECPQKQWRAVTALIRSYYPDSSNRKVTVFDVRRVAERLYTQLVQKPDLIDLFVPLLDSALMLRANFAFERALPQRPATCVTRERLSSQTESLLEKHSLVGITGLSGAGKTFLALDLCHKIKTSFEQVLWLDGDEFKVSAIQGLKVERLGQAVNLLARISESRALLVVDNWLGAADELEVLTEQAAALSNGSRVLLTSQQDLTLLGVPCVRADSVDLEEARKILSVGSSSPVPEHVVAKAFQQVAGFPLVLAVAREIVTAGSASWDDIETILAEAPKIVHDGRSILQRLMNSEWGIEPSDLAALAVLGAGSIDRSLLRHMVGPITLHTLRQRSLLGNGARGLLTIHELVVVVSQFYATAEMLRRHEEKLWEYFSNNVLRRPPHYIRSLYRFSSRLAEKVTADRRPGCLMRAYLDLEEAARSPIVAELAAADIASFPVDRCAIGCFVEALELHWRSSTGGGAEQKKQYALALGGKLRDLIDDFPDPEIAEYLQYHAAKFFLFGGDHDSCLRLLERCDQDAWGTRLQTVRCLREKGSSPEALEMLDGALRDVSSDGSMVPPTMALALFSELGRKEFQSLIPQHLLIDRSLFFDLLDEAIVEGNGHPYDAVVTLAGRVGYDNPEFLSEVFSRVELPEISETSRRTNDAVGKLYLLRATHAEYDDDKQTAQWYAAIAASYLEHRVDGRPSGGVRDRARCLELVGRYDEALKLLDQAEPDPFVLHAKGRTYLRMGQLAQAKGLAEEAVAVSREDSKLSHFLATFLGFRGDVEAASAEYDRAIESWNEALGAAPSERFSHGLRGKIEDAKRKLLRDH